MDQKKAKGKEGQSKVFGQGSDSGSISSSDVSELRHRAQGNGTANQSKTERGVAFLERPTEAIKGIIPGEKGREEREGAEMRDDEAVGRDDA